MTLETISLSGTAATRGGSLGRARSDALARWLTGWLGSIARAGVDDPKGHIARMLNETAYLHAIESHAPDLLEEIESMARGAELPLELVLAGQLMDEEWEYRRVALGRPRPGKCTSFAIRDQGSTWIGQNMDLDPFTDGHQLLLTIAATPAEPAALVFTVGGMVALMGVNASGVVVCVNALPDLPGRPEGLPVAFVIRKRFSNRARTLPTPGLRVFRTRRRSIISSPIRQKFARSKSRCPAFTRRPQRMQLVFFIQIMRWRSRPIPYRQPIARTRSRD